MTRPRTAADDLRGVGIFYSSRDMLTPAGSAEKCADAGASWAAVLVEAVDGRRIDRVTVRECATQLRSDDVLPVIYSFPDPGGDIASSARYAVEVARFAGVDHVCADFEPFDGHDWTQGKIDAFLGPLLAAGLRVSVTVFTRPKWARIRWPAGVPVILQVYERARERKALRQALARWPELPIPAVGTYLGDLARLRNDLGNIRAERPDGRVAVWSLATTDAIERAELRRYALATK